MRRENGRLMGRNALVILLASAARFSASPFETEIAAWHRGREAALTADGGWC